VAPESEQATPGRAHIEILISTTRPELEEGRALGLEFRELSVHALIDTGASLTVINPQIASTCKLKLIGTRSQPWAVWQVGIRRMQQQFHFPGPTYQASTSFG